MKVNSCLFILWVLLCGTISVHAQQQWNLPLLANWDDDSIPSAWTGSYSECWGYAANDREYAFLASTQGTYFFDITEATNPVLIDFIRTKDTTTIVVNKDFATYSHYLYAVSDQGDNSLQIFDLQYLPDSVVLVYDDNTLSKRCHTLFVERDRLYMCHNTRPNNSLGPMDIFSLANPIQPVLLGTLSHPNFFTVHEVHVKNDTAYCANGYNGLWIYDVKNPASPTLISILNVYPENGYNHSAWLTPDSKTMVFTDENHGYGVKVFDLSDIHDPKMIARIQSNLLNVPDAQTSNGSIAHNPYIIGNILLLSYYHDGVQAYDISNPAEPKLIAYYDTYPEALSYASYKGCWGLYPFLPSGNIIASDVKNGLFILDGKKVLNYQPPVPLIPSVVLGENPVKDVLEIIYTSTDQHKVEIEIFDLTGRIIHNAIFESTSGINNFSLALSDFACGIYIVNVQGKQLSFTSKFIKSDY